MVTDVYPQPNQHGVYLPDVCEVLTLPGVGTTKRARGVDLAHVLVVQVGPRTWLQGLDYQYRHGSVCGYGSLPYAKGIRYASRAAAVQAAAERLLKDARAVIAGRAEGLERAPDMPDWWTPPISTGQEREARALEAWALSLLAGREGQMELFAGAAR